MYCGKSDCKGAIWINGLMYPACNSCYQDHAEEMELEFEDVN